MGTVSWNLGHGIGGHGKLEFWALYWGHGKLECGARYWGFLQYFVQYQPQ